MATPTYVPLATTTLDAATSSVTFSNIDQSFGDLVLSIVGTVGTANATYIDPNGDSSNLSYVRIYGTGSVSASDTSRLGLHTAESGLIWHWFDYTATDKHKTFLVKANSSQNQVGLLAGRWASTAAITSLTINHAVGDFNIGTTISLWGIAK